MAKGITKINCIAPDGFLKPGLTIAGGKQGNTIDSTRSKIYSLIPPSASVYFEPFLGSGSILVGRPQPFKYMFAGDTNIHNINFFQCVQNHPEHLFSTIKSLVGKEDISKEDFLQWRKMIGPEIPEDCRVEIAAMYYLITRKCVNAIVRFNQSGFCNSPYSDDAISGLFDDHWIYTLMQAVRGVRFMVGDFMKLLDIAWVYPKDGIIVLDPPYYGTWEGYSTPFGVEGHKRLATRLKTHRTKWLMTINDVPEVRALYSGCNLLSNEVQWSCSIKPKGRSVRNELIITNFEVPNYATT